MSLKPFFNFEVDDTCDIVFEHQLLLMDSTSDSSGYVEGETLVDHDAAVAATRPLVPLDEPVINV